MVPSGPGRKGCGHLSALCPTAPCSLTSLGRLFQSTLAWPCPPDLLGSWVHPYSFLPRLCAPWSAWWPGSGAEGLGQELSCPPGPAATALSLELCLHRATRSPWGTKRPGQACPAGRVTVAGEQDCHQEPQAGPGDGRRVPGRADGLFFPHKDLEENRPEGRAWQKPLPKHSGVLCRSPARAPCSSQWPGVGAVEPSARRARSRTGLWSQGQKLPQRAPPWWGPFPNPRGWPGEPGVSGSTPGPRTVLRRAQLRP